jgi:hypothetical protein
MEKAISNALEKGEGYCQTLENGGNYCQQSGKLRRLLPTLWKIERPLQTV